MAPVPWTSHSADRARQAFRAARAAGFDNISLDLMFWLPGQSLTTWLATVDEAIASPADAVTLSSDFQNPNSGSDHGTWPAQDGTNTPIMLPNGDVHPSH